MIFLLFMAWKYEKDRLKEKKIEKISKEKIFCISPKSTTTTIKRESSQAKKHHDRTPSSRGFIYSLSFFHPSYLFSSYTTSIVKLGPGRPKSQAMYSLFINAKVFSILLFFLLLSCIIHLYILLGVRRSG